MKLRGLEDGVRQPAMPQMARPPGGHRQKNRPKQKSRRHKRPSGAGIHCHDLIKRYGDVVAVVDLTVKRASALATLGCKRGW
jgi:hypothetical protein